MAFYGCATLLGPISSCSTTLTCSTKTENSLIRSGTRNRRSSCFSQPSYFLHLNSSVTAGKYNLAKYSNLCVYAYTVRFPCWKMRNSTSLMFGVIREVFLQELCSEVSPGYLLCPCLHQLLHPHQPVLRIRNQQEGDEGQLLCISALYNSTDFLALPQPCICFVRGGLA